MIRSFQHITGIPGILFLLAGLSGSCGVGEPKNEGQATENRNTNLASPDSTEVSFKRIPGLRELYEDSGSMEFTDKGSFWRLNFRHGKIYFEFNPSCEYGYPARLDSDRIVFFWDEDMNCNFDRGLHASFRGVRSPTIGKPFGEIRRLDDSTLYIKYYYDDWIQRVNHQERKSIDTLFPTIFRKIAL